MDSRHFIDIPDAGTAWWDELYSTFCGVLANPEDYSDACRGSVMASLFFEPSTRTKFSFQSAMLRLGGSVFGFDNPDTTSGRKGETLADTIRMTSSYSDVIVMRSPQEGAARAASLYSEVPVINGGDGARLHPTQTLTDLAALAEIRGKIADFTIGLCGDLRYGRTVYPLVTALSAFPGVRFVFIAPGGLKMSDRLLRFLRGRRIAYDEFGALSDALPRLDVLYMTRVQNDRAADAAAYPDEILLTRDKLASAKRDLTILHPLPRGGEIPPDVDADPRARYFQQARYGMYMRMALLLRLTRLPRQVPPPPETGEVHFCGNPACITGDERYLPVLSAGDGVCGYCGA